MLSEEIDKIREELGAETYRQGNYAAAAGLFEDIIASDELAEFLTLKAYETLEN